MNSPSTPGDGPANVHGNAAKAGGPAGKAGATAARDADPVAAAAGVDTYLRFAEAVNRLDIAHDGTCQAVPQFVEGMQESGAKKKTRGWRGLSAGPSKPKNRSPSPCSSSYARIQPTSSRLAGLDAYLRERGGGRLG